MEESFISHEGALRFGIFAGLLLALLLAESVSSRRALSQNRTRRWVTNLLLMGVNTLVLRLLFAAAAVGAAMWAAAQNFGLFHQLDLPILVVSVISIILMDLSIYGQHVATHKLPWLWRLHRVHHVDRDIDVTTGVRFHPGEILLSMLYKMAVIMALGAPAFVVIMYEILLSSFALWDHANIRLPAGVERALRTIFVTPDMHRVHHSVIPAETDSNYGNIFSVWDRLFGTYIAAPRDGHDEMTIGLRERQFDDRPSRLGFALIYPFGKQ